MFKVVLKKPSISFSKVLLRFRGLDLSVERDAPLHAPTHIAPDPGLG